MKERSIAILLVLLVSMVPLFYFNRWLQRVMHPRENVSRLFIFLLANFVLIVAYTVLVVGVIAKIFPLR
ncbi:MAG TPA: hypothetical protein VKU83_07525 [Puia sp.]|nr:hypothetical protein [Puia sp.]